MVDAEVFPRGLSEREISWLRFILPESSPGYDDFFGRVAGLTVLGEGRWGRNDYVLGETGQEVDRTEGMRPVKAYGEIYGTVESGTTCRVTVAVHEPNEEGMVEFQVANLEGKGIPEKITVTSRWTYSTWRPGQPCPATGGGVREVVLNEPAGGGNEALRLVLSPQKNMIWLYDGVEKTVLLVPVTNYYNELMVFKEIRDPKVALDHNRLFTESAMYSDDDLMVAFRRYNNTFTKVDRERLAVGRNAESKQPSILDRLKGILGGRR